MAENNKKLNPVDIIILLVLLAPFILHTAWVFGGPKYLDGCYAQLCIGVPALLGGAVALYYGWNGRTKLAWIACLCGCLPIFYLITMLVLLHFGFISK